MTRARLLAMACALLALASCTSAAVGPAAPLAREVVPEAPAFDASAARRTVVDFVHAYAESPTGVDPLAHLVAGADMATWVRWLAVQHREFDGTITTKEDLRDVEFIGAIDTARAHGAQVGLSATVTFMFSPVGDVPIERARVLDGPVTLVLADGGYRVIDLYRDGMLMSDGIQSFRDEQRTDGGVTVTLDSLFMFTPNWQFNIEISNATGHPLEVVEDGTGLFVDDGGGLQRDPGASTPSLRSIGPGERTDGIMVSPIQDSADGRTLVLTYRSVGHVLRFAFPLGGLVDAIPTAPSATGPSGPSASTGSSGASGASGTGPTGPTF
jgi:hypothetical protein